MLKWLYPYLPFFQRSVGIRSNFGMLWSPTTSKGSLRAYDDAGPNWLNTTKASQASSINTSHNIYCQLR